MLWQHESQLLIIYIKTLLYFYYGVTLKTGRKIFKNVGLSLEFLGDNLIY